MLVVGNGLFARADWRDHRFGSGSGDAGTKPIRIEPLVAQELVEIEAVDQRLGLLAFVRLAPGQDKSQRVAEGIDGGVDLRAQSAARTPDRLVIGAPFLRRQHADVHGRWWHR